MAANGQGEKRSAEEAAGEEPVLSLLDVLEEDDALEDEACAVLGGSDAENWRMRPAPCWAGVMRRNAPTRRCEEEPAAPLL
ncbi:hypothetical protein GDO81_015497 [Engystomops pustulosus]|uniref:Uncharacterized protein n=1 Tax=Engystomops pustulosus TaxID=76066 RepID=A0AAV7AKR4_ENGPU|nr:hypothetical protein GDO81_015497 [Engystomops pustulosus]